MNAKLQITYFTNKQLMTFINMSNNKAKRNKFHIVFYVWFSINKL